MTFWCAIKPLDSASHPRAHSAHARTVGANRKWWPEYSRNFSPLRRQLIIPSPLPFTASPLRFHNVSPIQYNILVGIVICDIITFYQYPSGYSCEIRETSNRIPIKHLQQQIRYYYYRIIYVVWIWCCIRSQNFLLLFLK